MSYDKQQGMISQIYLYEKGHIFSFQNMHIHIYLHLESKPQNYECEMQNKPKLWTTVKSLFLPASYSHDSPLQEPGIVPHTFLLCFQDHCYLNLISVQLSCIDSSSHQFPPPWLFTNTSTEHRFLHHVFIFHRVIRFSHYLNIFPSFLIQLTPMLHFQKSIQSNVLVSSVLTHCCLSGQENKFLFSGTSLEQKYCPSKGQYHTTP